MVAEFRSGISLRNPTDNSSKRENPMPLKIHSRFLPVRSIMTGQLLLQFLPVPLHQVPQQRRNARTATELPCSFKGDSVQEGPFGGRQGNSSGSISPFVHGCGCVLSL